MWAAATPAWWCASSRRGGCAWWGAARCRRKGWVKGQDRRPARGYRIDIWWRFRKRRPRPASRWDRWWWAWADPRVRGANSRGVLEMGYVREIEQRDINRVVDRATARAIAGRPHAAAGVSCRISWWTIIPAIANPLEDGRRAPGEQRPSADGLGAGTHCPGGRREPGAHGRGRDRFRGVGGLLRRGVAGRAAARASRWWTSARNPREMVVYYGDAMYLASHVQDLRRPLYARPGAGPVPGIRRRRDGEDGIRRGAGANEPPANAVVDLPTPENREPRAGAAPLRQPDSAGARRGVVPPCARGTGPRGDGACADRRRVSDRRSGPSCRTFWTWPKPCCSARRATDCRSGSSIGRKAWTIRSGAWRPAWPCIPPN